jgi:hypothetical protein
LPPLRGGGTVAPHSKEAAVFRVPARSSVVVALALILLTLSAVPARSQQASAGLQGRVMDEQGGVLPGVPIVARSQESGTFRQTVSAEDGTYRFLGMQPGLYVVEAQLSGFAPYRRENVRLEIGQTLTSDVRLQIQAQSETVTVTAEAPIVDTTTSQVGGVLTTRELAELPSVNRNFTSFLALLPGSVPTYNTTSFGADSVQVGGQPAGNVNYNLDGGANNDSFRGGGSGAQARIPIEAVQEFQFLTGQFEAEFGGTAGAIVNAVSKQGTNAFHGTGFLRSKSAATTTRDYFVKKNNLPKPDTQEHQFGGTIGGPVVRDKAHFFSSFERVILDQGVTLNIPARPEFNSAETWRSRVVNIFNRFDHQVTQNHSWGVRWLAEWSPQRSRLTNNNVTKARATSAEDDIDSMVVGSLNSVLGSTTLNTFRTSYTYEDFTSGDVSILDDYASLATLGPSLQFATFGDGPPNLANGGKDKQFLINDTLSFYKSGPLGGHSFKVGGEYSNISNLIRQGGSLNGVFSFSATNGPFNAADPRSYPDRLQIRVPVASNPLVKVQYYSAFFQDKWSPTGNVTISLGVRYELAKIPLDERANPLFPDPTDYPMDTNDVAPRLGFSWDPFRDQKMVIRGGWGLFYNQFRNGDVDQYLANGVLSDSFLVNFPANNVDPGPSAGRLPTDPLLVNGPVVNRALLNTLFPPGTRQKNTGTVELDNPDRRTPYTHTTSIGFTRQMWGNSAVSVDYTRQASRALDLPSAGGGVGGRDLNSGLRINTTRTGRVDRIDPNFVGPVMLFVNEGRSNYDGLSVQFDKRPSRGFNFRLSYTLGFCNELYSDQLLQDLQIQEAPCTNTRRHNLTLSGGVDVPHVRGLRLSAVSRSFTGTRFTIQDTNTDTNRNGILFEPLPPGTYSGAGADGFTIENDGGRNGATGPGLFQLDLRISYDVRISGRSFGAYAEIVNLTDHVNFDNPAGDRRLTNFLIPTGIFGGTPTRTLQGGLRFSF